MTNCKCENCKCDCHCDSECSKCSNDVCVNCKCEHCNSTNDDTWVWQDSGCEQGL